MRPATRVLASVIAALAVVVGSSSSALAAAGPTSSSLDTAFCYQDATRQYCFDVKGTLRYLDTAAGSSVQVNKVTRTTAYEGGVEVGSAISAETSRSVFESDGTVVTDTIVHTHSTFGDEPCQYRLVLRMVDYTATVVHEYASCAV